MLPLALFRIAAVNVSALIGLALNFGYYGLMFAMSLFFQQVRHDNPLETGLAFLPMTAVVAIANLASGALTVRFGYRLPMIAGQLVAGAGYLSLGMIGAASSDVATSAPLLAVGIGVALAVPSVNSVVLAHVDASSAGIASGVLNTARQIGGVLGVGVFGALLGASGDALIDGLHEAGVLAGAVMAVSAVVAWVGLRAAGGGRLVGGRANS
jgi:DHA2 family methylenomycin A resistance protein-like MFS transporter